MEIIIYVNTHSIKANLDSRYQSFVYPSTTVNAMGATSRIGVPFASNLVIMRGTINMDPVARRVNAGNKMVLCWMVKPIGHDV